MAKEKQIGARVSDEVREALDRAAEADSRTVSFMVGKVVEEWLRREGWLKADKPSAASKRRPKP